GKSTAGGPAPSGHARAVVGGCMRPCALIVDSERRFALCARWRLPSPTAQPLEVEILRSFLRAFREYLLRHARILLLGIVLIIIANLIALIPPLILQQAIDGLGGHATAADLGRYALLIIGIALGAGVFQFCSRFVINAVSRQVEYEMRADLFQHFQRLDLHYSQEHNTGDLVARPTNDLSQVRMMFAPGIANLCNTMNALTVSAVAMAQIDTQLALYSLTVMPLITALFILVGGGIRRRFRQVQDQFGEVSARAQENFSGIRVVKAYAQERSELEAF